MFERQVSLMRIMESVRIIGSRERPAGSQGERETFAYLERELLRMGYHTKLYGHDAYISLPIRSSFLADGEEIPSQTHAMSAQTEEGGMTGPLVYCANMNALPDGEDFAGKIIVTGGRAVFSAVKKAEERRAAGLVCIQELPIRECIPSAAWGSPTPFNKALLPHIPVISIGEPDGERLIKRLLRQRETGSVTGCLITQLDSGWRKIPLLTGQLDAPIKTDLFAMFTGHVDSWYYGAIDNGTSNAVQLETARIVSENSKKLKRNFRVVFFSGHSQGRYAGSAWYADSFWADIHSHCVVNINADSLGGRGGDDITRSIIMPETRGLAADIIKRQTGVTFTGVRCLRAADQSFWNAGVSSAFASFSKQKKIKNPDGTDGFGKGNADLGWWWHTPEDTIDNVEPGNLLRDAKVFTEYTMNFLTSEVLPLDFRETAKEIRDALRQWKEKAGSYFSLEDTIEKSERLLDACRAFYEAKLPPRHKNEILLLLGRILVPLNYTSGDIYANDPALPQPPVPALALIEALAGKEPQSDEVMELRVELRHKKNYVNHSLDIAIRLLENGEESVWESWWGGAGE